MLIQARDAGLRLVRQHDHGLLSGELAAAWDGPLGSGARDRVVVLATALHDLGWRELDATPRWNPETGGPYDFLDLPPEEKFEAAVDGIDRVEELHPYAAVLISLHYSTFGSPGRPSGFEESEEDRRVELLASLEDEAPGPRQIQADLSALRLFDNLSLLLCLTPPGADPDVTPSWLGPELLKLPEWTGREASRIRMDWRDEESAVLDPWPFEEGSLSLEVPYRDLPGHRFGDPEALATAWGDASPETWTLQITGP